MPISIAQIANNTASVTIPVDEQNNVTVEYYPAHVTEKTFAELDVLGAMNEHTVAESFGSLNSVLSSLIKSWDVYEDDSHTVMYPFDPASLSALPIVFRMNILFGIMKDIRPEAVAAQTTS